MCPRIFWIRGIESKFTKRYFIPTSIVLESLSCENGEKSPAIQMEEGNSLPKEGGQCCLKDAGKKISSASGPTNDTVIGLFSVPLLSHSLGIFVILSYTHPVIRFIHF
jgi:hypothetical protein